MALGKIFRGAIAESIGVVGLLSLVFAGQQLLGAAAVTASTPLIFSVLALGVLCMVAAVAIKTFGAHRDQQRETEEKQRAVSKEKSLAPVRGLAPVVQKAAEASDVSFVKKYQQEQTIPGARQL